MFVRWKRKKLAKRRAADFPLDYLKYAQLVQTNWETGKPRQKVVKYLGSIRESHLFSAIHQKRFWQSVQDNLNQLQLDYNEKEGIIDKLFEVVPMDKRR